MLPALQEIQQFLAVAFLPVLQCLFGILQGRQRLIGLAQQILRHGNRQPEDNARAQIQLLADGDIGERAGAVKRRRKGDLTAQRLRTQQGVEFLFAGLRRHVEPNLQIAAILLRQDVAVDENMGVEGFGQRGCVGFLLGCRAAFDQRRRLVMAHLDVAHHRDGLFAGDQLALQAIEQKLTGRTGSPSRFHGSTGRINFTEVGNRYIEGPCHRLDRRGTDLECNEGQQRDNYDRPRCGRSDRGQWQLARLAHVPDDAVRRAHDQQRRAPFGGFQRCYGFATLGRGGVDGQVGSQRAVEAAGEFDRRPVADVILHRQHSRQTAAHQAGCQAGKETLLVALGALACVEDCQPQAALIGQQPAELGCTQRVGFALLIGQQQDPFTAAAVCCCMAHEVEDMPWPALQRGLKILYCLAGQPNQLDLIPQRLQRFRHSGFLPLDVQRGDTGGIGDKAEDANRRLDGQIRLAQRQFQVADYRGVTREGNELSRARVEQELPRHGRQLGRIDAQLDAQSFTRSRCGLLATVVDGTHLAGEQGVKKAGAEVLHPLIGRSAAGSQDCVLDGSQFCAQRVWVGKGKRHRRPRLPGRRVEHGNGVVAAVAGADFQVKVA